MMKLDRTFSAELRKLNGDVGRDAKFATLKRVKDAKRSLSTPDVIYNFDECVKVHGRSIVALCVASTLYLRRERINFWGYEWAKEVIALWTNRGCCSLDDANIDDGLHPTRICDYAELLIILTTE